MHPDSVRRAIRQAEADGLMRRVGKQGNQVLWTLTAKGRQLVEAMPRGERA